MSIVSKITAIAVMLQISMGCMLYYGNLPQTEKIKWFSTVYEGGNVNKGLKIVQPGTL